MLCLSARVREHLPERAPCVPLEFGSLGTTAQARPDRNCPRKKRGANGGKNPCGKRRGDLNLTRDSGLYFNSGESVKAGLARAFDLADITKTEGCLALRVFAKSGNREYLHKWGWIMPRCIANQKAQSASRPTLAKTARACLSEVEGMGHPQSWWFRETTKRVGHPPRQNSQTGCQ